MSFTPQLVIDRARVLLNDTRTTKRYSDEQMLGFFNDAMQRMFVLRPDAFSVDSLSVTVAVGSAKQTLASGEVFLGVQSVEYDGATSAAREVFWQDFTNAQTLWLNGPDGVPTKFVKDKHNSRQFFVNPRPASGVAINVFAALRPVVTASMATTYDRPSSKYVPALTDCVMFLASSIDDEHVVGQRAQMFYESFINQLGAGEQVTRRNSLESVAGSQEMRNDPQ